MERFMKHDFKIDTVRLAMYVAPGKGVPIHENRPFHGLAFHSSTVQEKKYIFSDGKEFSIGENDIIYMPKGSNYSVSSKELGGCFAINFELSEELSFSPFTFKVKNVSAFLHEFEQATKLWKNKRTAYQMQSKAILYQILSMMQEEYQFKYITQSTAALIAPAAEYLHNHYSTDVITIPQLAELCGISEDYFRKIFRNVYGVSPRKYINELKLSYARELLRSGMYTVTEVAELSGFLDTSYFSREFKKSTGVAPKEYK